MKTEGSRVADILQVHLYFPRSWTTTILHLPNGKNGAGSPSGVPFQPVTGLDLRDQFYLAVASSTYSRDGDVNRKLLYLVYFYFEGCLDNT